jgi:hypothetical protein
MGKLRYILAGAAVALPLSWVLSPIGQVGASQNLAVTVTNTGLNPVPVTGTVNANVTFPATQNVAGTVNVGNLPATQTVNGSVNATTQPRVPGSPWYQTICPIANTGTAISPVGALGQTIPTEVSTLAVTQLTLSPEPSNQPEGPDEVFVHSLDNGKVAFAIWVYPGTTPSFSFPDAGMVLTPGFMGWEIAVLNGSTPMCATLVGYSQ